MRRSFAIAVLALLTATPTTARAYTVKTTDHGDLVRWDTNTIPIRIDPRLERLLPIPHVRRAVRIASESWDAPLGTPEIALRDGPAAPRGYDPRGPTSGLYLGTDWPAAPHLLAVTVSTWEAETGQLLDADVLLHPDRPFALLRDEHAASASDARSDQPVPGPPGRPANPRATSYDVGSVITHELGHVLGLDESNDHPAATMWPHLSRGSTHQRSIEEDDFQGARSIYAERALRRAGCGGASVSAPSSIPAGSTLLLSVAFASLLLRLRSRRRRRGRAAVLGAAIPAVLVAVALSSGPAAAREGFEPTTGRAAWARLRAEMAPEPGALQEMVRGEAHKVGVHMDDGLLWTEYQVRNGRGRSLHVKIAGGRQGGIVQRVGPHSPPSDGSAIAVVPRSNAPDAWAYTDQGTVHGGWVRGQQPIALPPELRTGRDPTTSREAASVR